MMTTSIETVQRHLKRVALGAVIFAVAAIMLRYSHTSERWFQRPAGGRVIDTGDRVVKYSNRTYTVPTLTVEYETTAGTRRVITRDRPFASAAQVGAEVTVWYSPSCNRDGRLSPDPNLAISPAAADGLLVILLSVAVAAIWAVSRFAWRLHELIPRGVHEVREMIRYARELKACYTKR